MVFSIPQYSINNIKGYIYLRSSRAEGDNKMRLNQSLFLNYLSFLTKQNLNLLPSRTEPDVLERGRWVTGRYTADLK